MRHVRQRQNSRRLVILPPDISAKPVGAGAVSQPWISQGRTIWIADAHRGDGQRFIVHVDEKLTAFLKFEWTIRGRAGALLVYELRYPDVPLASEICGRR